MGGQYAGFILSAYGISAIALAAISAWIFFDSRAQKKAIADLEARGIRRRSAGGETSTEKR